MDRCRHCCCCCYQEVISIYYVQQALVTYLQRVMTSYHSDQEIVVFGIVITIKNQCIMLFLYVIIRMFPFCFVITGSENFHFKSNRDRLLLVLLIIIMIDENKAANNDDE